MDGFYFKIYRATTSDQKLFIVLQLIIFMYKREQNRLYAAVISIEKRIKINIT